MALFKALHRSKKSRARIGEIQTAHGTIHTPTFVPCATKGTLKGIMPNLIPDLNVQLAFVNTYHLVTHPGPEVLTKAGGVHIFGKLPIPLMSDSGGFQVFSLGRNERRTAKLRADSPEEPLLIKISEDGVKFRSVHDGAVLEFTPETSIQYQRAIGADLMMAFDECTYHPATHEYATKSMNRTHEWLLRCIKEVKKSSGNAPKQHLYGIIQGGQFEDLRRQSAEFIANQDVEGVAIGGVSVGETKEEMRAQVKWCAPSLPDDKPVHLLGIGQFDDIIDLIGYGIDTFDCVEPTRLARMGILFQWKQVTQFAHGTKPKEHYIDVTKSSFKTDLSPVDEDCPCNTCTQFSKSYLHHLFKQRELLGYTLATYHNVFTMERFMKELTHRIEQNTL